MRTLRLLLLLIMGCDGSGDVAAQHGRCSALEGRNFTSLVSLECGLTPTGVALCPWHIEIGAADNDVSTMSWRHSDVAETLRVTCDGAMIATATSPQRALTGWYDTETRQLTWDDVTYSE